MILCQYDTLKRSGSFIKTLEEQLQKKILHLFSQYLLSPYYVPGTFLSNEVIVMNKKDKYPLPHKVSILEEKVSQLKNIINKLCCIMINDVKKNEAWGSGTNIVCSNLK